MNARGVLRGETMAYVWDWYGLANLVAAALLLLVSALFLRAPKSEFTVAFAGFSAFTAASKFTGGVWLYFAADEATSEAWRLALTALWIPILPLLAHALCAFTWGREWSRRPWTTKAALYAPFPAMALLLVLRPGTAEAIAFSATMLFALLTIPFLVLVGRKMSAAPTAVARTHSRYVFGYCLFVLSATILSRAVPVLIEGAPFPHWQLATAYTLATSVLLYGILRTHLFDIDLRVKIALGRGTIAAIFLAVFFGVSEGAAAMLTDSTGSAVAGIVAASVLVFFLAPLQRLGDRVASSVMPGVEATPEYLHYRKLAVYRSALESALEDGRITDDERSMLEALAAELSILPADREALERDVRDLGA